MSQKRKIIFKEALFNVPFLLIVSALVFAVMFLSGRSAYDIEQIVKHNLHSDAAADVTACLKTERKAYKLEYYYGDNTDKVLYAEFEYKGKGDTPESTLTLYEARDGFDSGIYTTVWFFDEEYVTYRPLGTSQDSESFEKYLTTEVPLMYQLVNSYSWDGAMLSGGAADGGTSGYKLIGLRLFLWDHADNGNIRENFLWTIGANPRELYSYIPGTQGEYKKVVFK